MTDGVTTIPFRYDYEQGGFHMDYMRKLDYHSGTLYGVDKDRPLQEHHKNSIRKARCEDPEMLRAYNAQLTEHGSKENISLAEHHCYSATVAADIDARVRHNPAATEVVQIQHQPLPDMEAHERASRHSNKRNVTEVYNAWHPDERETKGVKPCLKATKKNMPTCIKEFHAGHDHLGTYTGCWVCKATKGAMRKIHKVQDPCRDTCAGYAWSMDTVTMSDRSFEQHKYLLVLKYHATGYVCLIPLQQKSQSTEVVDKWIQSMRSDPVLKGMGYEMVQHITTDRAGEWDGDCATWIKHVKDKWNIKMKYIAPERHESNSIAERACAIVEQTIKSILMQNNLPPEWWSRVSQDAEFLLNRFPVTSAHVTAPLDGDRARPIEVFTQGYHSRRRYNHELSYYVSTGTPCLVHVKRVKGSALAPKVRWGVAAGRTGETAHFMCPFTKSRFASQSYTAYKLRQGICYTDFLGLPPITTTGKLSAIPDGDGKENVVLVLPRQRPHPMNNSTGEIMPDVGDCRSTDDMQPYGCIRCLAAWWLRTNILANDGGR